MRPGDERDRRPTGQGGIPDGLLVGLLAFLLGMTVLVWAATGLSAVFAHGSWPDGVTFARTPLAMRRLIARPHDLPGAWPDADATAFSGYGLFWGLFVGQLMILVVLTVFILGTVARWRALRVRRKAGQGTPAAEPAGAEGRPRPATPTSEVPSPRPTPDQPPSPTAPHRPPFEQQPPYAVQQPPYAVTDSAGPAYGQQPAHQQSWRQQSSNQQSSNQPPFGQPDTQQPDTQQPDTQQADAQQADAQQTASMQPPTQQPPFAQPATPHSAYAQLTEPHSPYAQPPPQQTAPTQQTAPQLPLPQPGTEPFLPPSKTVSGREAPAVRYGPPATRHPTATQAVRDAEGPALVLTSNPALWEDTKDARAKLGPVHVYDPTHLCDTPARLHWSPTRGCENKQTAAARAIALLAPIRPTAKIDQAVADVAETLLRSYLHAAAIDGRTLRHVHRWSQGSQIQDAVRTLRTNPKAASGSAGELEAALTAHPERRDIAQELAARALAGLSTVNIREACTPNRTDALALDSFVNEGGTLYVVGESIEDPRTNPGAMPFLTALTSSVVERGRHMAERSSSGRLDPPLTLVLDDVAAVAPLPQLPELLAVGRDRGLPTLALLRSREQARTRWPNAALPA
ncbi:hypothetical protein M2271_006209 [Streptomyces sp. LBL]|uniref:type IV secretory system conjugative DNA transfer family protein n=1 Tax=Streptomyces sp. LBL TaxID=2940562 RepID=UPI0024761800|nr:type VI secretion protein [Streptomyces sp. LBL]MDH6628376.1 hypothetical protein [Streptomyces sp. LBL]